MSDAQNPDLVVDEDEEPAPPSLDDLPPLPVTLEFSRLILMHKTNPVAATESFQLFERMATRVAEAILEDLRIDEVTIEVRKLRPPVPQDLASSGIRLTVER